MPGARLIFEISQKYLQNFYKIYYYYFLLKFLIEIGSRDGAVVRALVSHQRGQGSISRPGVICGLSLLLVLDLAPWVFLRVLQFS